MSDLEWTAHTQTKKNQIKLETQKEESNGYQRNNKGMWVYGDEAASEGVLNDMGDSGG